MRTIDIDADWLVIEHACGAPIENAGVKSQDGVLYALVRSAMTVTVSVAV